MSAIQMNYGAALDCARRLKQNSVELGEVLNEIKAKYAEIENVWTGDSSAAMRAKLEEFSTQFANLVTAISDCSDFVEKSATNYQTTEQEINNIVNSNL